MSDYKCTCGNVFHNFGDYENHMRNFPTLCKPSKRVHFHSIIHPGAACGKLTSHPNAVTSITNRVNCGNCKRTKEFKALT